MAVLAADLALDDLRSSPNLPVGRAAAAAGMPPNQAFDAEHAALKACSRRGATSRAWYLGVRARYGEATP